MKWGILPLLAIALFITLGACTPTGNVVKEEPVTIGGLFALSGGGESWGVEEMRAAQLAITEANEQGFAIKLTIEDTQTNPRITVTALQRLLTQDPPAIIGPTWDESAAPIAPIADNNHVVLISPSISEAQEMEQDNPYLYTTWYSDIVNNQVLCEFMRAQGVKKIAIVHNKNVWSEFRHTIFNNYIEKRGVVVDSYVLNDDTQDFRTTIIHAMQQQPDALYIIFTSDESIGPFMKQASELGVEVPIYSASGSEDDFVLDYYEQYDGLVYHTFTATHDQTNIFREKFKAEYGAYPSAPSAATAYDATRLIIAALRSGERTGPEIKAWLDAVQSFPGVGVKNITFDDRGYLSGGTDSFVVRTVEKGVFVDVT